MNLLHKAEIEQSINNIPSGIVDILTKTAQELHINKIAIVGGLVRDLIISKIHNTVNPKLNDIDLLIEGETDKFFNLLVKKLGNEKVKVIRNNIDYKTIELQLLGIKVDIASARTEIYSTPGSNPDVTSSSLKKDLYRRDFSINSIALELIEDKLIDPFSGIEAIKKKKLEFLHPKSVLEDPTRIIRAARYSARLNFEVSSNSLNQIKNTLDSNPWGVNTTEWDNEKSPPALASRLGMELNLLLNNEPWVAALKLLQSWGALSLINLDIQKDNSWQERITLSQDFNLQPLTILLSNSQDPIPVAKRLGLSKIQEIILSESCNLNQLFNNLSSSEEYFSWSASRWSNMIEANCKRADSVAILICKKHILSHYLLHWHTKWRFIKSPISGKDLIDNGWETGPKIGKELERLRLEKIDNEHPLDEFIKNPQST